MAARGQDAARRRLELLRRSELRDAVGPAVLLRARSRPLHQGQPGRQLLRCCHQAVSWYAGALAFCSGDYAATGPFWSPRACSLPGSVAWLHGGRHVGLLEEQLSERRVVQAAMQSGWLLATAGSAPDGDDDLDLGARRGPRGPGSRRPRWSAWRLWPSGANHRPGTRSVTATGQWPDPAAGLCGSPVRWRPPRPPRPRRQTASPLLSSLPGAD